jgi:hypothetical protein
MLDITVNIHVQLKYICNVGSGLTSLGVRRVFRLDYLDNVCSRFSLDFLNHFLFSATELVTKSILSLL